jgi:hypothetical protein
MASPSLQIAEHEYFFKPIQSQKGASQTCQEISVDQKARSKEACPKTAFNTQTGRAATDCQTAFRSGQKVPGKTTARGPTLAWPGFHRS